MSTKVVPAPETHASRPVREKKLAKQAEKQEAAKDEDERVADDDSEVEVVVADAAGEEQEVVASETSLAGDFAFDGALADAAASAGSLVSEGGEYEVSYGQYDDGDDDAGAGSIILLIGAIALVGLGVAALASGGDDDNDIPVPPPPPTPPNTAPTITVEGDLDMIDEDDADGVVFTVTTDDAEDDDVTVTATSDDGTVTDNGDGTFTFVPDADFEGDATITFVADDGTTTTTTTQTVTVNGVNDAPTLTLTGDPADGIDEDDMDGVIITADVLDVEGDDVTVTATSDDGTVVDNGDGTFTFVPNADFNGTATVTFVADDGTDTTTTDFEIDVAPVNDAPVAGPDNDTMLTVENDDTVSFTIDAIDADDDELTAELTREPENGTVTGNGDGMTATYDPDDDFVGTDSFEITVSDGNGGTLVYEVTVTVTEPSAQTLSIDVPASGPAVVFDLDDDEAYVLTDDVDTRTDVIVTGFDMDDVIEVTGADAEDYFFGTSPSDSNDLRITFNDGTNFTQIILDDVLTGGFVFDYDSAVASVGFDFMTFG